jgi:hypothetical protein
VLRSFDAQEPAEAMLASHVVLAHQFTLECYRRAAPMQSGGSRGVMGRCPWRCRSPRHKPLKVTLHM